MHVAVSATTDDSTPGATRNCYYHGDVVGDPQSWVALSTCHGISGVVHAHGETFAITPDMMDAATNNDEQAASGQGRRARTQALRHMSSLSTSAQEQHEKMSHQHIVYRLSDYKPLKTVCGVTEENDNPLKMMHQQAIKAQSNAVPAATAAVESSASSSSSSSSFQSPRPTAPRLGADGNEGDMRWIEMLVINDYDRHQRLGESTEHETLSLSQLTLSHPAAYGEAALFQRPLKLECVCTTD